jgi:hypothetical protein
LSRILETKKWIEDYDKAVEMTDELQLAMSFIKKENLPQKN